MISSIQQVAELIRNVPDFPKPGIMFKDIVPVLNNAEAFSYIINSFAEYYRGKKVDQIVGIESRGFIFGAPLAFALGVPFNIIRKPGKLPAKTKKLSYDLEYGSDTIEIHEDSIKKGMNVVIVDDLLATGGTAGAAIKLIESIGGNVLECAFIVELSFLNGRNKLNNANVHSLISY